MDNKTAIFISWSGSESQSIAKNIKEWLLAFFSERIDVFFTPDDIETGRRWSQELAQKLQNCDIGIFIYTRRNLDNLWMAFEAGALSKKIESSRVIPVVFGAHITDINIKSPISQFQARRFEQESMLKILEDINNLLPEAKSKDDLKRHMHFSWNTLENEITRILDNLPDEPTAEKTNIGETLDNMYALMRSSPLYEASFTRELIDLAQQIKTTQKGSYLFIGGEKPAFSALIAATMRAKETIRSTRFFPMAITGNQDSYGKAIYKRVLGDEENNIPAVKRYARIIAANNPDKLKDIERYFNNFCGYNFDLYLTKRENSFELVIIDEEEVFIHFYGEGKVIKSTLHIVGEEVTKNFIEIYRRLHDPQHDPDILKIEFKYLRENMVHEQKQRVEQFFYDKFP